MTEDFENLSMAELKQRGVAPKQILAEMKRRGMSPHEIINAWRPNPLSNRVGSRTLRRRVVIAMYGSWLFVASSVAMGVGAQGQWNSSGLAVLALGALAIMTVSTVWLGRRTYVNSPQIADRDLDERLLQIKNQAYRTAFRIFTVFVVVAWPFSLLLAAIEPGGRGTARGLLIYFGVGLLVTTLPTAVVAWREPDPAESEALGPSRPR